MLLIINSRIFFILIICDAFSFFGCFLFQIAVETVFLDILLTKVLFLFQKGCFFKAFPFSKLNSYIEYLVFVRRGPHFIVIPLNFRLLLRVFLGLISITLLFFVLIYLLRANNYNLLFFGLFSELLLGFIEVLLEGQSMQGSLASDGYQNVHVVRQIAH